MLLLQRKWASAHLSKVPGLQRYQESVSGERENVPAYPKNRRENLSDLRFGPRLGGEIPELNRSILGGRDQALAIRRQRQTPFIRREGEHAAAYAHPFSPERARLARGFLS